MSWFRVELNSAEVAAGKAKKLEELFSAAFVAARAPRTMALYQKQAAEGAVVLFLTPACAEAALQLAQSWGAMPCERPSFTGLHLLVGHHEMAYYIP